MARRSKSARKLAALDTETYGFKAHRMPVPFAAGFYDGTRYLNEWGIGCCSRLLARIAELPDQYVIYAHNGGRFDFHMFLEHVRGEVLCIGGRLGKFNIGKNEFRDSYLIFPEALDKLGGKLKIDYEKFEPDVYEKHKPEILEYMFGDLTELYRLVKGFRDRFGDCLTVGQAAMKEFKRFYQFDRLSESLDPHYRQFYYGGRVECYESGMVNGPLHVFDVNSMYPAVMAHRLHPINGRFEVSTTLPENMDWPFFAIIDATSRGAFPRKTDDGTSFDHIRSTFAVTSHELQAALELGLVDIHNVLEVCIAEEATTFADFVDFWILQRQFEKDRKAAAKAQGNDDEEAAALMQELFCKRIANSCYGKFGSDPSQYTEDYVTATAEDAFIYMSDAGWLPVREEAGFTLWQRDAEPHSWSYFDVTIAASITGAARAKLLRGLRHATRPVYCDTDSIICSDLRQGKNLLIDRQELGAWKLEARAKKAAIAGKKLYALYNGRGSVEKMLPNGKGKNPEWEDDGANAVVKKAHKGGELSAMEIMQLAKGETIDFVSAAPTFSLGRAPKFTTRTFQATTKVG